MSVLCVGSGWPEGAVMLILFSLWIRVLLAFLGTLGPLEKLAHG